MATSGVNRLILQLRRAALLQQDCGLTDGALLESYVSRRDEVAFEVLVRRHGPMVLGVCRRILRNEADAEDAFQATFLVLVRKASSVQPRGQVSNWLYGVAHNTALKARAMIRKRHSKEREAGAVPKPEAAREVWHQVQVMLDTELSQLPDKYRVPIVLCELEEKTIKEASRHLDWPQGTVATRLARGRALLAKRLSKHGLELSGGVLAALLSQNATSACVPTSLASSTVKAASLLAAGGAAASVVSAKVAALIEGVLTTMLVSKLQNTVATLVVLALLFGGAGLLLHTDLVAQQTDSRRNDNKVSRDGDKPRVAAKRVVVRQDAILQRMAMSSDGEVVATVGVTHDGSRFNSTVKLWDARTGKLIRALDEEKDSHLEIAFSRDLLAIGVSSFQSSTDKGPREVRLLDAKTLELKHKIDKTIVPDVYSWAGLAFSPDGKRLAVAGSTFNNGFAPFLKLWDVGTRKLIEGQADLVDIPREQSQARCLALSPDGKLLATAWDDGKIRLFDGQTGAFRTQLATQRKPGSWSIGVGAIAFSPDSKTLATKGDDNTVLLWDLTEGKPLRGEGPDENKIKQLIANLDADEFAIREKASKELEKLGKSAEGPMREALAAAGISPEAKRRLEQLLKNMEGRPGRTLNGQKGGEVEAIAYSRDGRWIAIGSRTAIAGPVNVGDPLYEVILRDVKTGEVKQTFSGLTEWVHVVAFSPDGKTLAVCGGAGRTADGGKGDVKTSGELTLFRLE